MLTEALYRSLHCNNLLADALFELLAEKGVLSGEEVLDRIKRMEEETRRRERVH